MPVIDLGDWEKGIDEFQSFSVWAVMCHPDNEEFRKQFISSHALSSKLDCKREYLVEREKILNEWVAKYKHNPKEIFQSVELDQLLIKHQKKADRYFNKFFNKIVELNGGEELIRQDHYIKYTNGIL